MRGHACNQISTGNVLIPLRSHKRIAGSLQLQGHSAVTKALKWNLFTNRCHRLEEQSAIDSGGSTVFPDPTVVWSESVTLLLRGISAGLPW